mmetsp:Transcript_11253/g.45769  ORF Transcript_11253/g.45769 Transcript_11253/m.45769 type:complete len:1239 (-) Transcript_11253:73-3789(-)
MYWCEPCRQACASVQQSSRSLALGDAGTVSEEGALHVQARAERKHHSVVGGDTNRAELVEHEVDGAARHVADAAEHVPGCLGVHSAVEAAGLLDGVDDGDTARVQAPIERVEVDLLAAKKRGDHVDAEVLHVLVNDLWDLRREAKLPASAAEVPDEGLLGVGHDARVVADDLVEVVVGLLRDARATHDDRRGAVPEEAGADDVVRPVVELEVQRAQLAADHEADVVRVLGGDGAGQLDAGHATEASHHEHRVALHVGAKAERLDDREVKTRHDDAGARDRDHVRNLALVTAPVLDGAPGRLVGERGSELLVDVVPLVERGVLAQALVAPEELLGSAHGVALLDRRAVGDLAHPVRLALVELQALAQEAYNDVSRQGVVGVCRANAHDVGLLRLCLTHHLHARNNRTGAGPGDVAHGSLPRLLMRLLDDVGSQRVDGRVQGEDNRVHLEAKVLLKLLGSADSADRVDVVLGHVHLGVDGGRVDVELRSKRLGDVLGDDIVSEVGELGVDDVVGGEVVGLRLAAPGEDVLVLVLAAEVAEVEDTLGATELVQARLVHLDDVGKLVLQEALLDHGPLQLAAGGLVQGARLRQDDHRRSHVVAERTADLLAGGLEVLLGELVAEEPQVVPDAFRGGVDLGDDAELLLLVLLVVVLGRQGESSHATSAHDTLALVHDHLLDVVRVEVAATDDDHVLDAASAVQLAVADKTEISGAKIVLVRVATSKGCAEGLLSERREAPVAGGVARATDPDLSNLGGANLLPGVGVDDLHRDEERRRAARDEVDTVRGANDRGDDLHLAGSEGRLRQCEHVRGSVGVLAARHEERALGEAVGRHDRGGVEAVLAEATEELLEHLDVDRLSTADDRRDRAQVQVWDLLGLAHTVGEGEGGDRGPGGLVVGAHLQPHLWLGEEHQRVRLHELGVDSGVEDVRHQAHVVVEGKPLAALVRHSEDLVEEVVEVLVAGGVHQAVVAGRENGKRVVQNARMRHAHALGPGSAARGVLEHCNVVGIDVDGEGSGAVGDTGVGVVHDVIVDLPLEGSDGDVLGDVDVEPVSEHDRGLSIVDDVLEVLRRLGGVGGSHGHEREASIENSHHDHIELVIIVGAKACDNAVALGAALDVGQVAGKVPGLLVELSDSDRGVLALGEAVLVDDFVGGALSPLGDPEGAALDVIPEGALEVIARVLGKPLLELGLADPGLARRRHSDVVLLPGAEEGHERRLLEGHLRVQRHEVGKGSHGGLFTSR